MTALKKYARLESSGLWKESQNASYIEVLITFGKTSLILSDFKDNPLTHWSLTAIKLESRNQDEAIFSAGFEDGESLLIKDKHMIDSLLLFIYKEDRKHKSNSILSYFFFFCFLTFLAALILYFPSKTQELAVSIISKQHERQIIDPYLKTHIKTAGGICRSAETDKIMRDILILIEGEQNFLSVSILRDQKMDVLHLPSGIILLSNEFIKSDASERKLISLLNSELPEAIERQPLKTLINQQTTFKLISFILGFETQLSITNINDFSRHTFKNPSTATGEIDDFSWVTLQNACLR